MQFGPEHPLVRGKTQMLDYLLVTVLVSPVSGMQTLYVASYTMSSLHGYTSLLHSMSLHHSYVITPRLVSLMYIY